MTAATVQISFVNESDSNIISNIYGYYVTNTAISAELKCPSSNEIQQRIINIKDKYPWIVCKIDGKIIGYCYASGFKKRPAYKFGVELSIYFDNNKKYYGIGQYLYQCAMDILRYQGYYYCIGVVVINKLSKNSQKLHEKLGFNNIGIIKNTIHKFDKWHDVIYYQKFLKPFTNRDIRSNPSIVPIQVLMNEIPDVINGIMQQYEIKIRKHISSKL